MESKRYQLGELAAEIRVGGSDPTILDTLSFIGWAKIIMKLFPDKQTEYGYIDEINFGEHGEIDKESFLEQAIDWGWIKQENVDE